MKTERGDIDASTTADEVITNDKVMSITWYNVAKTAYEVYCLNMRITDKPFDSLTVLERGSWIAATEEVSRILNTAVLI